jgi:hypothetical protein
MPPLLPCANARSRSTATFKRRRRSAPAAAAAAMESASPLSAPPLHPGTRKGRRAVVAANLDKCRDERRSILPPKTGLLTIASGLPAYNSTDIRTNRNRQRSRRQASAAAATWATNNVIGSKHSLRLSLLWLQQSVPNHMQQRIIYLDWHLGRRRSPLGGATNRRHVIAIGACASTTPKRRAYGAYRRFLSEQKSCSRSRAGDGFCESYFLASEYR